MFYVALKFIQSLSLARKILSLTARQKWFSAQVRIANL